jgi:serine/threonine protein kinase
MNAEALIGTVLGTCTLQKLIGQGGMGAVFLAQQSRPRRQVAVKVLMPMTPLNSQQLAAFLERFRRETDAAASLEHPNIVPVYEYGEREGLAYLVMPYVSGGTLRDEMERLGTLPLSKIVNYLDQMAAALDCAHAHGVIHRDIKPANILMTLEGRLLLTDFGLVKVVSDRKAPQARLTGVGVPVGTPDYMAPEQVIGEGVDARADIYSLGVIVYQMVTGTTPFQGESPMQIAAQHLHIAPPSPQLLRPDLPDAAEQVILRALAKKPDDRYATAQEFADAFHMALIGTGIQLTMEGLVRTTNGRLRAVAEDFDLTLPTSTLPSIKVAASGQRDQNSGLLSRATGRMPAANTDMVRGGGGLLSRTGKFPQVGSGFSPAAYGTYTAAPTAPRTTDTPPESQAVVLFPTEKQMSPALDTSETLQPTGTGQPIASTGNTIKLTNPVKVVQVPVAGQPGVYVTGLLPMIQPVQEVRKAERETKLWMKAIVAAMVCVLLLAGIGAFFVLHSHATSSATHAMTHTPPSAADMRATAIAQSTATADANIILFDPLSSNTHNWLTNPPNVYAFKDGAYHITDRGNSGRATVLQGQNFTGPLGYTLTMEEIGGDDNSAVNSFGMIIRFSQQTKNGKAVTQFYSFEVVNTLGGEYQFWKYDDSNTSPWTELWHQPFGAEFHEGHGPQSVNTCKIFAKGNTFTITMNGKMLKTIQDGSLASGTIGMIVNLDGTEVAFKNLLLTNN